VSRRYLDLGEGNKNPNVGISVSSSVSGEVRWH